MQSLYAFEQAVVSTLVQRATCLGTVGGAEPAGEVSEGPSGARLQSLRLMPTFVQQLADAMVAILSKADFGQLEEVVDR